MKPVICLVAITLAACTPPSSDVPGVQEAAASEVANCEVKGSVTGIPGVFGPLKDIGLQDARKRALSAALQLGADTVVFDPLADDAVVTELNGRAYKCA